MLGTILALVGSCCIYHISYTFEIFCDCGLWHNFPTDTWRNADRLIQISRNKSCSNEQNIIHWKNDQCPRVLADSGRRHSPPHSTHRSARSKNHSHLAGHRLKSSIKKQAVHHVMEIQTHIICREVLRVTNRISVLLHIARYCYVYNQWNGKEPLLTRIFPRSRCSTTASSFVEQGHHSKC